MAPYDEEDNPAVYRSTGHKKVASGNKVSSGDGWQ
jgi:hypothetical protein